MDTVQIDKKISVPGFLGAFGYDELPTRKDGDFSLIVNTEVSTEPGDHWVALVQKEKLLYFLDSYGRNFKDSTFPSGFRKTILKYVGNSRFKFNPLLLQQFLSNACGDYCVYFIQELDKGGLTKALSIFSNDLAKNDRMVVEYVKQL